MKKIYICLICSLICTVRLNGQITLTKASHEPVIGDVEATTEFDSTSAIPKSIGANQNWNFTSLAETQSSSTSTYVAVTAPSASMFPGASLALTNGGITEAYFKTSASKFEMLGFYSPFIAVAYTVDARTYAVWPIIYGNSFTDTYSGKIESFLGNGNISGSATITASGHGAILLPGISFNNVLQLRTVAIESTTFVTGTLTSVGTETTITYDYYVADKKKAILSVQYTLANDTSIYITMNKEAVVGINDYNFNQSFVIYPNPAKEHFAVKLSNENADRCTMAISSVSGQVVKQLDLGDAVKVNSRVDITDLPSGVYIVKTNLGARTSVRKLLIE